MGPVELPELGEKFGRDRIRASLGHPPIQAGKHPVTQRHAQEITPIGYLRQRGAELVNGIYRGSQADRADQRLISQALRLG
jgi:hypothetical protein